MPMLIKIVELGFSWPSFNSGLYRVALGLNKSFTVAGTDNDLHIIPHQDSIQFLYTKLNISKQVNFYYFKILLLLIE